MSPAVQRQVIERVLKSHTGKYALFADTIPAIESLKQESLKLGIITNADKNVHDLINGLGLKPYLDVVVTSDEVGVEKPGKAIFLAAIERMGICSSEAIYVGDQYQSDVLGAVDAGIVGMLIDRYDIRPDIKDHPRIQSLNEVINYIN